MSGQWTQFRGNSPRLPGVTRIKISPFTFGCIPLYPVVSLVTALVRTQDPPRAKWQPCIELEMVQDMITQNPRPINSFIYKVAFRNLNLFFHFHHRRNCIHDYGLDCIPGSQPYSWSPRGVSQWEPYITVPAIIYHFTTFYTNRSSKSPLPRCPSFKAWLYCGGEKLAWDWETEKT